MNFEKIKNISASAVFFAIIFGLCAAGIMLPERDMSLSERRKLARRPAFTAEDAYSGKYSALIDKYLLDQFPLREGFRSLKASAQMYLFRRADTNGYYLHGGAVYKQEYPLNTNQVLYAAGRMSEIAEKYLSGSKVFYSVIPDKNYFAAAKAGQPSLDYAALFDIMRGNTEGMQYIDITDCLSATDYYRTDTHWRQERIYPVAERLSEAMGSSGRLTPFNEYERREHYPFRGVFLGQSALPVKPDTLVYMTNETVESAKVAVAESPDGEFRVYDTARLQGADAYEVFLSGARAIVEIECDGPEGHELVIFRDSFGSSVAPYFMGAYSKITLIDLRYVHGDLLGDYVNFEGCDALFLYSTLILNSGMLLK